MVQMKNEHKTVVDGLGCARMSMPVPLARCNNVKALDIEKLKLLFA